MMGYLSCTQMTLLEEKHLVELCKTDLSHFKLLYKEYITDVYRYSYSKLTNKTEAEEVVSETFLAALENIQNYKFMDKSIKHWLFIIARNIIYKSYRKPVTHSLDESWEGAEEDKVLDMILDKDVVEKIEAMIRKFKPPVPEIIRLKIWEDMSFEEIAEILNKSTSAVKMSYYRALKKVQEELQKEGVIA